MTETILIYGGAFDPPHIGHVRSIEEGLRAVPGAFPLVVPSVKPFVAGGASKQSMFSFDERYSLCKKVFGPVFGSRGQVSDIESSLVLDGPCYSLYLVRRMLQQFKGAEAWLLLGQDQLAEFASWFQPRELLELVKLAVLLRRNPSGDFPSQVELGGLAQRLNVDYDWLMSRVKVLKNPLHEASSSEIRAALRHGKMPNRRWIPQEIQEDLARVAEQFARSIPGSP